MRVVSSVLAVVAIAGAAYAEGNRDGAIELSLDDAVYLTYDVSSLTWSDGAGFGARNDPPEAAYANFSNNGFFTPFGGSFFGGSTAFLDDWTTGAFSAGGGSSTLTSHTTTVVNLNTNAVELNLTVAIFADDGGGAPDLGTNIFGINFDVTTVGVVNVLSLTNLEGFGVTLDANTTYWVGYLVQSAIDTGTGGAADLANIGPLDVTAAASVGSTTDNVWGDAIGVDDLAAFFGSDPGTDSGFFGDLVVPTPGSLAILGMAGLAATRRRRR